MGKFLDDLFHRGTGLPTVFSCVVFISAILFIFLMPPRAQTFDNVSKVIELAILSIGLLSIILIARQTRTTAKWSKLLSYHQFFGDLVTPDILQRVRLAAKECGFEDAMKNMEAMPKRAVDSIHLHEVHDASVGLYLDEFEEFCGAVQAGVVDEEYAYTLEATRVIRIWVVFEPFIRRCRATTKYSRCYLELQRLGEKWQKRRVEEEAKNQASNGVRPHV